MGPGTSPESVVPLIEQELQLLASGVRIIALRSLGDADTAREVVQESLARALKAIAEGQLRNHAALGGFVRSIARHVIADEIRARSRTVPLDPQLPEPADEPDPLDALVHAEDAAAIRAALRTLSPRDRRVIQLSFVDGLTPAAVAERLREPRARVRKRKSRALERLREAFFAARRGHETAPATTLFVEDGSAAPGDRLASDER